MGITIHQLRGVITSDIRGFVTGMEGAGAATRKLVDVWKNASAAIWSASQRVLLAVTGMTVAVTKTFADFEDAMIEVGAITRTLGTRDFDLLKKAAMDMGERTRYSATEAAGGLKQLSLSGLDANQSIAALGPTLQLATSSGLGIGQAAGISAKLMKAMGIEARGLAHVNDVLVSTFQRSNTDLTQLSEGMKHAAPLAHTLGISLEDVTAVLAKMADAGFQGEMGGTALRNIMSRLAGAMPRLKKQFSEIGIETLDASGKMRPLLDILGEIEAKGLSAGKIMELFGQRGGPQLLALLEVGIGGIKRFSEETKNAAGSAAAVEKARVNTIKGQFDELMSYLEGLMLAAGEKISPVIRKLIEEVEQFFRVNRADILEKVTKAAEDLVAGLRSLFKWVVENRRAMWELVDQFGKFISWIFEFMAAHPQLMAALVALKITGILGLNDAVIALGKALVVTVQQLFALKTAAGVTAAASATAGTATAASWTAVLGPIALVAAALGGIGLLFYKIRADAVTQIKRIEKALEELAAKNRAVFEAKTNQKIEDIKGNENPLHRSQLLAQQAEDSLKEEQRWMSFARDPTVSQKNSLQFQEIAARHRGARASALDATMSEVNSQYKPKLAVAGSNDAEAAKALSDEFEKIKAAFMSGTMTANQFGLALEKLDIELDKVARGFDPAVESLYQDVEKILQVGSKGFDQTNQFLKDLNTVKNQLGPTFNAIVGQVSFLNEQLANGVITQEQYLLQIKELAKQNTDPIFAEKNEAAVKGKIEEAKRQREIEKYDNFDSVKDLLSTDTAHMGAGSVAAIGNSVEGATPEIVQQLVDNFTALQQDGTAAVEEGMDDLILSFLKAVESAKAEAETQNELSEAAFDAYKKGGTQSDMNAYGKASGLGKDNPLYQAFVENQKMAFDGAIDKKQYAENSKGLSNVAGQSTGALEDVKKTEEALNAAAKAAGKLGTSADQFRQQIKSLTDQFALGEIDEEQFTEKMKELRKSMADATAQGTQLVAMEEQYRKIMALKAGDLKGAGVNLQQMIMDKVQAHYMGQVQQWVDWYVSTVLGLGNATQNLTQGFQDLGDGLAYYATEAGNWFEGKGGPGGQGDPVTTWSNFVNSVQGQVALLNNTIAEISQGLQLTNLTMTRKLELQRQIDELVRRRDALLNPPPATFIGVSQDPFLTDPGLTQSSTLNQQGQNGSGMTINQNFPNVNKFSSADASILYDAIEREGQRRGRRF